MSEIAYDNATSVKDERRDMPPLYAARVKVYAQAVTGFYRRIKWAVLIVLLGIYYLAPWLRWDRGPGAPDQMFLIDMPNRRAYFLWVEIWPQEVHYLAGMLILGAIGLFFVTSLFGRVWCGYTCPQTVWSDLFMWIERRIEGDRNARMRFDKAPWTFNKIWRRSAKHAAFVAISLATGGAWIMYFKDAPTLVSEIFSFEVHSSTLFFIGLFSATTYLLGGIAREQVCTYMCPWPRFQAAMFDEDTMIVTYEGWRGEPRGKHKKGESWEGRGDCIDCRQCVAVCPTGIDIRDGNQLECIGCGLCIDACNRIMERVGRPPELITYDTIRRSDARARGERTHYRLLRPRTLIYATLLVIVGAIMAWSLLTRTTVDLHAIGDRAPLYVTLSDGDIRNGYTIRVLNKVLQTREFILTVEDLPRPGLSMVGGPSQVQSLEIVAAPDAVTTERIFVEVPADALGAATTDFRFVLKEIGEYGERVEIDEKFHGPEPSR